MALRINSEAPNFSADSTKGRINFHEFLDGVYTRASAHAVEVLTQDRTID